MILEVSEVHKTVPVPSARSGEGATLKVLSDISFTISPGSTCAFIGPSGSGKTTLLGLCAGLDLPSTGTILFEGQNLGKLTDDERALLRRSRMGFVFQNFQLIPNISAIENVMLPLELGGTSARTARTQAASSLDQVGLQERLDYYPAQLSGGEQQRVAIARALVHTPSVLFADEPTGNLDLDNASKIIDLLFSLNSAAGVALVLVTHNPDIAARCSRQITLRGGKIAHG